MSAAHDPLFASARVAFCAALSRAGVNYNALALDLEGAGLPRPSAGNARYRALILSLIRAGDEPWELTDRIRAAFRADLHTGYDLPPAPPVEVLPVEAAPAPHPRPAVLHPAGSAPVASVGKPISGTQIAWLKRLGAAPAPAAAAMVARMTPAQRSAAASLAGRLMSIPEVRVAAGRLA